MGGHPDALLTWATHHVPFLAAVEDGLLAATQFHPEKSGDAGATLLGNWVEGWERGTLDVFRNANPRRAANTVSRRTSV